MKHLIIGFVICISAVLVLGDDVNCTAVAGEDECCKTAGCTFSNCDNATSFVCTNASQVNVAQCANNATEDKCNATIDCSSFLDETTCCANAECSFNNCENVTLYICTNASLVIQDQCPNATDKCKTPPTTTATPGGNVTGNSSVVTTVIPTTDAPETTSTTNTSTGASTEAPPVDTTTTRGPATTPLPTDMTTSQKTPDCNQGQKFDAASFIGGIVLCGGIIVIIFFAWKFYKSRSERAYHQF